MAEGITEQREAEEWGKWGQVGGSLSTPVKSSHPGSFAGAADIQCSHQPSNTHDCQTFTAPWSQFRMNHRVRTMQTLWMNASCYFRGMKGEEGTTGACMHTSTHTHVSLQRKMVNRSSVPPCTKCRRFWWSTWGGQHLQMAHQLAGTVTRPGWPGRPPPTHPSRVHPPGVLEWGPRVWVCMGVQPRTPQRLFNETI